MTSMFQMAADDVERRIHWVQVATIARMIAEAAASLFAAWRAHSPALLAFGGDSAIELLSAAVVLWSIRAVAADTRWERNVDRAVGGLLFALAVYILVISCVTLAGHREPKPTPLGIAILIAAAIIMSVLAKAKRKLSATTGSAALRADAAQSATCAYLSVIALVGLVANAVWHVAWADPLAALAIVPFVVWEGREAMQTGRADVLESMRHYSGTTFSSTISPPLCERMNQTSDREWRETEDGSTLIEVMTPPLRSLMHPRKQVQSLCDMSEDNQHQATSVN